MLQNKKIFSVSHLLQMRKRKCGSLSLTVLFVIPVPLHWQGKRAAQIVPVYILFLSTCLVNPNCNESFRNRIKFFEN